MISSLCLCALACEDGVGNLSGGVIGNPSALDVAEGQAEFTRRLKELTPFILGAQGKGTCGRMLKRMEEREAVLDNALLLADVNSDGDSNREVYKLLGEKLKILDDLEEESKACQR